MSRILYTFKALRDGNNHNLNKKVAQPVQRRCTYTKKQLQRKKNKSSNKLTHNYTITVVSTMFKERRTRKVIQHQPQFWNEQCTFTRDYHDDKHVFFCFFVKITNEVQLVLAKNCFKQYRLDFTLILCTIHNWIKEITDMHKEYI